MTSAWWHGTKSGSVAAEKDRDPRKVFAEQYIDGREFTVCMYGSREDIHVLPPYEWMFNDFGQRAKIITYEAKWTERTFGYEHISAKLPTMRLTVRCLLN
jgi:D-alanine-D-alanine ligase-like ATP-grasp enzyme